MNGFGFYALLGDKGAKRYGVWPTKMGS